MDHDSRIGHPVCILPTETRTGIACEKPLGYSWFPRELGPMPVAWVRKQGNLVWHRQHSEVGSSVPLGQDLCLNMLTK